MYLNSFSVRIPEGKEIPGGYVVLRHNTKYKVVLRNSRSTRCDARVEIDGKHVGTWRLNAIEGITLERPAHDTGHFTFYESGSSAAVQLEEHWIVPANRGLVKVTFTPEKVVAAVNHAQWQPQVKSINERQATYTATCSTGGSAQSLSSGITGLSGRSSQVFGNAVAITHDYSQQTVIHLRLVTESVEPRPLTQCSTPVPPVV